MSSDGLSLLDREGRATARLAQQMRERGIAPLADLAEHVVTVIGDEQAFALMLRAGDEPREAPPVDAVVSDLERLSSSACDGRPPRTCS